MCGYLNIYLTKVATWLYGYQSGYIDIQTVFLPYLDIDIRARISVDIDISRSGEHQKTRKFCRAPRDRTHEVDYE